NTMDATSYGKLTVKLPLGNKQKFTNFAIASKAFKDSRKMDLGALAWVERNNKIMIEGGDGNTISFKGLTYKLVTSPDTGRVWLDRNLGATQVATKVDDSAAYGDYYQWGRAKDGHQSSTSGTQTPSSDIVSGNSKFIYGRGDWTTIDSSGRLRVDAWKDGDKNDICPAGFSVPTEADLKAETGNIQNINDAASSFLKIPAAGIRNEGAKFSFSDRGDSAYLWVNTASKAQPKRSVGLIFKKPNVPKPSQASFEARQRTSGMSVRCVRK
ncbi:hypothetical protein AZO1586I_91, partial [Bathymodiolus thermophilus thioautotrophic gill symbiont]